MNAQPEQLLENVLIEQLQSLGYESVTLKDESDLVQNFKRQIEKHNKVELSETEFNQIMLF